MPVARDLDRPTLIDHIPMILDRIADLAGALGAGETPTYDIGLVGAESQRLAPVLTAQAPLQQVKVRLREPADLAAAEAALRGEKLDAVIVDGRQIVTKGDPDTELEVLLQSASRVARAQAELAGTNLSPAEIRTVLAPPPLPVRALEPSSPENQARRAITFTAVFLLYGQIIGYGVAVASGVVEEKSTRVVEVLLATVRPVQLLAGKVIGIGLVGLVQLFVVGAVGLAVALAFDRIVLPPGAAGTIGLILVWFVLGYALGRRAPVTAGDALPSSGEATEQGAWPVVILKSRDEIDTMREAGRVVARTLERVRAAVRPGVTLRELDRLGERTIREAGATPSFLGYLPHFAPTPFPGSLCLSPNDVIVHGIPDGTRLRDGDLLSIDCGAVVDGYHGDAAITVPVGQVDEAARRLLETTERALWAGIEAARAGNRLSDISYAVGRVGHAAGYGIVPDFGGHGIGRVMHEDPSVLNDGRPGRGLRLREGLVLAIEPMFNEGGGAYELKPDGWALVTRDGSRSAHFEHTVAITAAGPQVLTLP
jgi:methionyl aminopeptidase